MARERSSSKRASATLDAVARKPPASSSGEPASPWPILLSRIAFSLTGALVIVRALTSETIREGFDVIPGSTAAPITPGPGATLFLNALCCLPAILILVRRALERSFVLRWTWSQVFFALLALWAAVSVGWSADQYTAVITASTMLAAAALIWSTAQLVRSWMRLRLVAGVAVGLLLAYAAQGLIYQFLDVPDNIAFWEQNKEQILRERGMEPGSFAAEQFERKILGGEMVGFNTSPNSYAAVVVTLMVITAGAAIQRRAQGDPIGWTIALLLPLVPAVVALIFTHTRTAAATLFIAAVSMALLSWQRLREWLTTHRTLAYTAGVVVALLGIAAIVGHGIYHGTLPGASLNFRWRYWVAGWTLFNDNPLLGVGWGNFGGQYLSTRLAAAAEEVRDPHNFLVRAFVELGLIGGALTVAWLARAAWEVTRPITPAPAPAPLTSSAPAPSTASAVGMVLSIAVGGVLLNTLVAIDWAQDVNFLILEVFRRLLFLGLICVAMVLVCTRSAADQALDDRPAPWLLYATIIALAVFFLHNLVDFVIAEPGAMTLFAVILGSVLGVRTPLAAGVKQRRSMAMSILIAAVIAWLAAMLTLVIPVADAEQRARAGDEFIRRGRPDLAAAIYRSVFESVPYNADYAYRAARALMMAQAPPEQVKRMLSIAIATEPTNVGYRLTRAEYELQQPDRDADAVMADFEAAVRLDPHNIRARLDYADALQKLSDPAAAARQIRLALETNRLYDPTEPKRLAPDVVRQYEQLADQIEAAAATRPSAQQE